MKKFPNIKLPHNTEFVLTSDIPALIADALYPEVKFMDMPIIDLYKISQNPVSPGNLYEKLWSLFSPTYDWYRPLSGIDEQVLHKIWFHLPKLEFPISRKDWKPYAIAFSECSTQIDFDLKEDYVGWLVEPNGHQKTFFEQNNYSSNILGMWMDDMDERKLILQCGMAEMEHIVLLREAIKKSIIQQLDPITHIPTNIYKPFGRVPIEEFSIYAGQLKINVVCDKHDPPALNQGAVAQVNKTTAEPDQKSKIEIVKPAINVDDIPGKMPKTSIGKLAVKAAWEIECATKTRANAKQVIEKLQLSIDDVPELDSSVPHGVKWVTTKGVTKTFDTEACAKALTAWLESRA